MIEPSVVSKNRYNSLKMVDFLEYKEDKEEGEDKDFDTKEPLVTYPDPLVPTIANFFPAGTVNETLDKIFFSGLYPKDTPSNDKLAPLDISSSFALGES